MQIEHQWLDQTSKPVRIEKIAFKQYWLVNSSVKMDASNLQAMSFDWLGSMHAMQRGLGLRPFSCNIVSTLEKDVKSYKEGD